MAAPQAATPQPAPVSVAPASVAPVPTAQPITDAPPAALIALVPEPADVVAAAVVPLAADPLPVMAQERGLASTPAPSEASLPPKPPLPKLQAIVFSPARPSIMISGKTLFIGDKLNEFRVTAIDRESATLVGAGQTNVLTLSQ